MTKDEKLRFELAVHAGFNLPEVPMVYDWIKGNNEALTEIRDFRKWRNAR